NSKPEDETPNNLHHYRSSSEGNWTTPVGNSLAHVSLRVADFVSKVLIKAAARGYVRSQGFRKLVGFRYFTVSQLRRRIVYYSDLAAPREARAIITAKILYYFLAHSRGKVWSLIIHSRESFDFTTISNRDSSTTAVM